MKWLPENNFQLEVALWARRMSDTLSVSVWVLDDPVGLSCSMGVAMVIAVQRELQLRLPSNIFESCIAE